MSGKGKDIDTEPNTQPDSTSIDELAEIERIAFELNGAFAVVPKQNCPHVQTSVEPKSKSEILHSIAYPRECRECKDQSENWLCLKCYQLFCSRYVAGHMANHRTEKGHPVCISLSDLSFWCFECDSYVKNLEILAPIHSMIHEEFFGYLPPVEMEFDDTAVGGSNMQLS